MHAARFQVGPRVYESEQAVYDDYMSQETAGEHESKFQKACRNHDTGEVEQVLGCVTNLDLREKLISKQDISTFTPLMTAITCRSRSALKLIEALGNRAYKAITAPDDGNRSAWFYTIQGGDKDLVRACLNVAKAQDRVWEFSTMEEDELPCWPPLHRAVSASNTDAVELLLEANGDRAKELVLFPDMAEQTALELARMNNKEDIVRIFEKVINK